LPANLPGIDLDTNGKCRYCREADMSRAVETPATREQLRQRFGAIINRLRGRGRYDCLVPFSGGKESSYILWVLVRQYGMRPLAFNFSNGFQHTDAIRNIETIVDQLGVDIIIYRPDQHMMRKLMYTFLSKAGEFCTPCNMLISATALKKTLAEEHATRPQTILSEFLKAIGMSESEFDDAAKKDFRNIPNMRNSLIFRSAKRLLHKVDEIRGSR
jgi:3'-phosphoadenosine 5'-phosphosulfate sulfotransferase (PAPS reductase)/FAD synthetase